MMQFTGVVDVSITSAIGRMNGAHPDEIGVYWCAFFTIAGSPGVRMATTDRRIHNTLNADPDYIDRTLEMLIDRGALVLRDGHLELPALSPMVWL